jgi:hypothetical protein
MITSTLKKSTRTGRTKEFVEPGFHQGNIILIISEIYDTILKAFVEFAQNMLDVIDSKRRDSARGFIYLNMDTNNAVIMDNGLGESPEGMRKRIENIAANLKGDKHKGFKGIGNWTGVAVARFYDFMSRHLHSDNHPFFQVKLDREIVLDQSTVRFPMELRPDIKQLKPPKDTVKDFKATTMIRLRDLFPAKYTRELQKSANPAQLIADAIAEQHGDAIRQTDFQLTIIVVRKGKRFEVLVRPFQFTGRREIIEISHEGNKRTIFELWVSTRSTSKPRIIVEHPRANFDLKKMPEMYQIASDVFDTGFIQGFIRINYGKENANRTGLEIDTANEIQFLSDALTQFRKENGEVFIADIRDQDRFTTYEACLLPILNTLKDFMASKPENLPPFLKAMVSTGHTDAEEGKEVSTRIRSKEVETREITGKDEITPTLGSSRGIHRGGKIHVGVQSPTGTRRFRVKSGGLSIIFGEPNEQTGFKKRVWIGTKGRERGAIVMNITHPQWRDAERKNNTWLSMYIRALCVEVLMENDMDAEFLEVYQLVLDRYYDFFQIMVPKVVMN